MFLFFSSNCKLAFNDIVKSQAGCYILELVNVTGKDTAKVNITVLDRPSPPEGVSASLDGAACTLAWKRSRVGQRRI